jgi:hypothetical protein
MKNANMDSEGGVAGVMTCRVIKTVTEDVAERWMDTTTRYQRRVFEVSWVLTELITKENYEKGARLNISVRR